MATTIDTKTAYEAAVKRMHDAIDAAEKAPDDATPETVDELSQAADDAIADVERARAAVSRAEALERARTEHPITTTTIDPPAAGEVRVTRDNELTYRQGGGASFFSDAYNARFAFDAPASDRLQRHAGEMAKLYRDRGIQLRDVDTSAFSGLIVPQYLIDEYAELARAGRPYANSVRGVPLPAEGMVLNIGRITTGTAVAAQATEGTAVQETDIDDTLLSVNVRTYAGQQDLSRQSLERGNGVDGIVYADLVADYHLKLNQAIINGDGTSGTHRGVRNTPGVTTVTYTDATPTLGELYAKLADAIQQMNTQRFMPATAILMHPRRWGWLTAAFDTGGRPLVQTDPSTAVNAVGIGEAAKTGQVVGRIHGLPVITDPTIPTNVGDGTNEDVVIVYRAPDHILWEEGGGEPRRLRFEETQGDKLLVKLVIYGYSAYTAGRYPTAAAIVTGTGLIAPTF